MHTLGAARRIAALACATAVCAAGCANMETTDDLAGAFADDAGKGDAVRSTKLVDDIGPNSTIQGAFNRRIRVYGYVVDVRRGAKLTISLDARPGADADREDPNAPLDTLLGVWGPFESVQQPGPQVAMHEDGDTRAAPPISFDVDQDGPYLIAFSSWEDTGDGKYTLDVSCQGTEFQCRRPAETQPCRADTLFLQGATISENTTWDMCEVVLLEPATVTEDAILTVKPGVVVKGNFLGAGNFGTVTLTVNGALQALGTREHPIAFTSLKDDRGWGGLVIGGKSSTLQHVFIERALTGVNVLDGASAVVTDAVLEGFPAGHPAHRRESVGVRGGADAEATFTRALVKNQSTGLFLENSQRIVVEDSVIRDNQTGVVVQSAGRSRCGNTPPPPPVRWRDPVFIHSDIVNNQSQGVVVRGDDVLIQIDHSNIVGNGGLGVNIEGGVLHPESFIHNSNVFANNNNQPNRPQLMSAHFNGVLDVSSNYWVHISDPELSQTRQMSCSGQVSFTGFSAQELPDAGPRLDVLIDPVKDQTWQQQRQD